MIKEEERRVLEMVAAGKVTPQEANLLLNALVSEARLPPQPEGVFRRWMGALQRGEVVVRPFKASAI